MLKKCFILIIAFCFFLTGCNKNTSETSKEKLKSEVKNIDNDKVLKIGCIGTPPGWIQLGNDGNLEGYDYDVMQEIAKRNNYDTDYQVLDWDSMWEMLKQERLDVLIGQISFNNERDKMFYLSDKYAYNNYVFLCAKNNYKLKTMNDLKSGMTIGVTLNSTDENIVKNVNEKYNINLKMVDYKGMNINDVALGRVDLWSRAETSANITVKKINNLKILGETGLIEEDVFPCVKNKRGDELRELINKTLNEMRKDGTLKKLSKKWFNMDITEKNR